MGRRAQGYRVRRKSADAAYTVRFRIDGERRELSTGTRDRAEAEREGRRLYAEELSGKRAGSPASEFRLTTKVAAAWVAALPHRPRTVESYEEHAARWLREIRSWDSASLTGYVRKRLRQALRKTVQTEVSAMRGLLEWLKETGEIAEIEALPSVPKGAMGTSCGVRRRVAAPLLEKAEIRAFLRRLPEKADKGWWVRPRCELLYETSLRPTTIDALSVPEHWRPGAKSLWIPENIDKEGFAREVPLTPRALAILKRCAPKEGVIFGEHKYYRYIAKAAKVTLPGWKADIFTGQHLRSARATHLLDAGASLTGTQHMLGHRWVSTTARYSRASLKEAQKAIKKAG